MVSTAKRHSLWCLPRWCECYPRRPQEAWFSCVTSCAGGQRRSWRLVDNKMSGRWKNMDLMINTDSFCQSPISYITFYFTQTAPLEMHVELNDWACVSWPCIHIVYTSSTRFCWHAPQSKSSKKWISRALHGYRRNYKGFAFYQPDFLTNNG